MRYRFRADPMAEETLRSALMPILWITCPTLVLISQFVAGIDHPGSGTAMRVIQVAAAALTLLTIRWQFRPPRRLQAAAALCIGILQLSLVGTLLPIPDPALSMQQVILALVSS